MISTPLRTRADVRLVAPATPARAPVRSPAKRPAALPRTQSVSVIGLGYVGAVSVACFSSLGFKVVGADLAAGKVADIAAGRTPIVEANLGDLLAAGVADGRVTATTDLAAAVAATSVTLISVGTPTGDDGKSDLSQVAAVATAIGRVIATKSAFHTVVLRCSVPPGTTLGLVVPALEAASGKRVGAGFGVAFVPEFLREGVAVADFFAPPKTVIAATDAEALAVVRDVFGAISADLLEATIPEAETVKYVDNVWHATKVVFGNEVGRLCHALGVDSHAVMDLFVRDTKLNISSTYLKPGFAFGGSCLPKEIRAVAQIGAERDVSLPLVESLIASNRAQIEEAVRAVAPFKGKRIALLGLTFKSGTDDVRESPLLTLACDLLAAGHDVVAFDANLQAGPGLQAQIASMRKTHPEIAAHMARIPALLQPSLSATLSRADVLVVGHATEAFRTAVAARRSDQHVLDLARLFKQLPADATYRGIAW